MPSSAIDVKPRVIRLEGEPREHGIRFDRLDFKTVFRLSDNLDGFLYMKIKREELGNGRFADALNLSTGGLHVFGDEANVFPRDTKLTVYE